MKQETVDKARDYRGDKDRPVCRRENDKYDACDASGERAGSAGADPDTRDVLQHEYERVIHAPQRGFSRRILFEPPYEHRTQDQEHNHHRQDQRIGVGAREEAN